MLAKSEWNDANAECALGLQNRKRKREFYKRKREWCKEQRIKTKTIALSK